MPDGSEQPPQEAAAPGQDGADAKETAERVSVAEVPPQDSSASAPPSEISEEARPADALGDEAVDTMSVKGAEELTPGEGTTEAVAADDAGSMLGSILGSEIGSVQGSPRGSIQGSDLGSVRGSERGSIQGSNHGSIQGSNRGSIQGSNRGSIGQKEGEQSEGIEDEGKAKAEDKAETIGEQAPEEVKASEGDKAPEGDFETLKGDGEAGEEAKDEGGLVFKEEEKKAEEEEQQAHVGQRKSVAGGRRRSSIGYHTVGLPVGRIADGSYEVPQIAGDFQAAQSLEEQLEPIDFEALEKEQQEYETQEEEAAPKEEEPVKAIDRAEYYELVKVYEKQVSEERTKNNYLQRRMKEYFKRRRMLHVLRESMYESDTQAKYEHKLDALDHLIDISTQETERIKNEVAELRTRRDDKKAELAQFFNKMQKREQVVGLEQLLSNKGLKFNVEKVVEQYLKHQRTHLDLMMKMRLTYIKIRDRLAEKQAALKALDNLGDNLHLVDYEQLKTDARNNADKLEDKDAELQKIREQCQNSMQILAHFREKSGAIDADIDMYNDRLEEIVREHDDLREQLLYLKQERDNYRAWTNKLRADSGLLTKPMLLRDMEDSLNGVKSAAEKLRTTKQQYNTLRGQVMAVRKHIEIGHKEKRERQSSLTTIDMRRASVSSRGSRGSRSRAPRVSLPSLQGTDQFSERPQ